MDGVDATDDGHDIRRIDNYDEWLGRFGTALRTLPDKQRQQSVLPLLDAYRKPEKPLRGAPAPTDVFRAAVQAAKIGADKDIPHLSADLIAKYVFRSAIARPAVGAAGASWAGPA